MNKPFFIINEYEPDIVTHPGETLKETLDALGMTRKELAKRMGKPAKIISDIINHKLPFTPDIASELEKVLNIPASFWNNGEKRYQESLKKQTQRKPDIKSAVRAEPCITVSA